MQILNKIKDILGNNKNILLCIFALLLTGLNIVMCFNLIEIMDYHKEILLLYEHKHDEDHEEVATDTDAIIDTSTDSEIIYCNCPCVSTEETTEEITEEATEKITEEVTTETVSYSEPVYTEPKPTYEQSTDPGVLTKQKGVNYNDNGNKETYYNLPMNGVINNAKAQGIEGEYWVREDGVKMYGDYVIVAANLDNYPRGSLVETSLGTGIVLDTGEFAVNNPEQFDIAVGW